MSEMTKERFIEVCMSGGLTREEAEDIYNTRPEDIPPPEQTPKEEARIIMTCKMWTERMR